MNATPVFDASTPESQPAGADGNLADTERGRAGETAIDRPGDWAKPEQLVSVAEALRLSLVETTRFINDPDGFLRTRCTRYGDCLWKDHPFMIFLLTEAWQEEEVAVFFPRLWGHKLPNDLLLECNCHCWRCRSGGHCVRCDCAANGTAPILPPRRC